MSDGTAIEWTHRPGTRGETWNPVVGCDVFSPGCTNCYAMRMAARLERMGIAPHYAGTTKATKAGAVWTGRIAPAPERTLLAPLRWTEPRTVFVNSMGDLFHEAIPDEVIDRIFAVMALASQHTFIVLTKRSARMRDYVSGFDCDGARRFSVADAAGKLMEDGDDVHDEVANAVWPLSNVWIGVSAEDQRRADERIPDLLATPAAIRFVSAEPLLGPINFRRIISRRDGGHDRFDALDPMGERGRGACVDGRPMPPLPPMTRLNWIIVGGESGPDARPMHPDWARSIRDQCAAAGVPLFFKQWGEWAPGECAGFSPRRTECTASLPFGAFGNDQRWDYGSVTPRESEFMHRDDEADLYRLGKKRAGRLLDGREHSQFPGEAG